MISELLALSTGSTDGDQGRPVVSWPTGKARRTNATSIELQ